MTAKAALAKALLDGMVLNVKNCFEIIGLTNCSREVSRMIEKDFDVIVSRTKMEGLSKYGQPVTWVNFRLNKTESNAPGIQKMRDYVAEQMEGTFHKEVEQDTRFTQKELFENI